MQYITQFITHYCHSRDLEQENIFPASRSLKANDDDYNRGHNTLSFGLVAQGKAYSYKGRLHIIIKRLNRQFFANISHVFQQS